MKIPTGSLVTGRQTSCVEHGNVEAVSFAADPVTVSAAPRYNVQIKNGGTTDCQYLGTFNFNGYLDEIYGWNDCRQENQGNVDRLQRFSAAFCLV